MPLTTDSVHLPLTAQLHRYWNPPRKPRGSWLRLHSPHQSNSTAKSQMSHTTPPTNSLTNKQKWPLLRTQKNRKHPRSDLIAGIRKNRACRSLRVRSLSSHFSLSVFVPFVYLLTLTVVASFIGLGLTYEPSHRIVAFAHSRHKGLEASIPISNSMALSTSKRRVDHTLNGSSLSTIRLNPFEASSLSTQRFSPSQSTLVSSSRSSITSYSTQSTLLSEPSSPDRTTKDLSENKDATARRYTRPIIKDLKRKPPTINESTQLSRMHWSSTAPPPKHQRSLRPRSPSASAAPPKAVPPPIWRHPMAHIHPDQIAGQNPNNIYARRTSRGPDLSKQVHPVPNIIITDYSLLLSAATRYAWSPFCLQQACPYHNIIDSRYLHRFFASVGANAPKRTPTGFEIVDVEAFAEMGGQRGVVAVDNRGLVQRKVVAKGCPSCACSCRGRGVAMLKCLDLPEEVGGVAMSGVRARKVGRMPVTDRIEEARRMRVRIEQRREARGVTSQGKKEEADAIQHECKVGVKQGMGRTKTVRRKRSKFVEIGCTSGNDLAGVPYTDDGAVANNRKVFMKTPVSGSSAGQDRKNQNSTKTKRTRNSWIKRLLHV